MTKKERALLAVKYLKEEYSEPICSLNSDSPFQLLVATRLSAQCTDKRVNIVTPNLFEKYPDAETMAKADILDIENLIRSTGFYRVKAKDLISLSNQIIEEFDGKVPDTIEGLTSLSGVGRKTANLILGDVYKKPGAVVTDTHLIRISNRIGLVNSKNPLIVERELRKLLPPEESNNFCHRCVLHGRAVCTARNAKCEECILNFNDVCKKII